ncbi:MAG: phage baseplate assembly protein V [Oxalobacter sp.]|nr:MAG: phage baseplate assembly protein V [Oxalobacter sp.]
MRKLIAPLSRRIRLTAAKAFVALINDATALQGVQVELLEGEVRDATRYQNYGLTSRPHDGAEGVFLSLNGSRDQGVVIVVDDRRYRLTSLEPGEVALYDDLGHKVHLTREGIVIEGAGHPVIITDTPKLRVEADIEATGQIKDRCDTAGLSMSAMRSTYNYHTHPENDSGGPTDPPSLQMEAE